MSLSINITDTKLKSVVVSSRDMTKAFVTYSLLTDSGVEVLLNRQPISFQISLSDGISIPSSQDLADLISQDCQDKFGGMPDNISIQNAIIKPSIVIKE